jgi:hypothetical protein
MLPRLAVTPVEAVADIPLSATPPSVMVGFVPHVLVAHNPVPNTVMVVGTPVPE